MFRRACVSMLAWSVSLSLTAAASAATYYVDFADGDDTADGRRPQSAWRHAPGDRNAAGAPAAVTLAAGDVVRFRGGVAYHGSIRLTCSGEPGKPITLDGGADDGFGAGRAVLDSGPVIERWRRCRSREQAQGAPKWRSIFYADIDVDIASNVNHGAFVLHRQTPPDRQAPWQRIILIDGDRRLLPIAQHPKPDDPFYPDLPAQFLQTAHRLDVRKDENCSVITDETNLIARDKTFYDGMFVGVHGGNNHVYFGAVKGYDPAAHQLITPLFTPRTYPATRYAFYNSVRLIERPGEWAIIPLENGKARVYLLPEHLHRDHPVNIGFPEFSTGVAIEEGASHIEVKGFRIQRYSGGAGGVSISRSNKRSNHIRVVDCEIRFLSGHAGVGLNYCDAVAVEHCTIHHCPGWTTGVFLSRVNDYVVRNCTLRKNSGSGVRHYECTNGVLRDNAVLDHFGIHSSGVNVYEGCSNLLIEGNYVHNIITINRNAENIVFRNNVIDGLGRSAVCLGMWVTGRTRGRDIKNIQFLNNTFVNTNPDVAYATGVLGQRGRGVSAPEGLVVRGNILVRITGDVNGLFEDNIYLRRVDDRYMGPGCQVVDDPKRLFRNARAGDFRRLPNGPAMDAGATIAPPPTHPEGF